MDTVSTMWIASGRSLISPYSLFDLAFTENTLLLQGIFLIAYLMISMHLSIDLEIAGVLSN
jgi:hypothetical protein